MSHPTLMSRSINAADMSQMTPPLWDEALAEALAAVELSTSAIATNPDVPTWVNTVEALERSDEAFHAVWSPFQTMEGADSIPVMQDLRATWAPKVDAVFSSLYQNTALYNRLQAVEVSESASWSAVQKRVYADTVRAFRDNGVHLPELTKDRVRALSAQLTSLDSDFDKINLQNANVTIAIPTHRLDGADMDLLADCARLDQDGVEHIAIPVTSTYADPLCDQVHDRAIRRQIFEAWSSRGLGVTPGDTPTLPIINDMLAARTELAQILGYQNHATRVLDDTMAKTPLAVRTMLLGTWGHLQSAVAKDLADLTTFAHDKGLSGALQAWDVPYYTQLLRQERFSIDMTAVKDYFPLPRVRACALESAEKVFGITFIEDNTIPTYHPLVVGYRVEKAGVDKGVLLVDDWVRPSKQPGAWMNQFANASTLDGARSAGVTNILNLTPPTDDKPTLLAWDDVVTLYHEMGHALHGLLGQTQYPSQSGTNVDRDFVELPSQLFENWGRSPEALRHMARHYQTGEPMPEELLEKLLAAQQFGQTFFQTTYIPSALADLELHEKALTASDLLNNPQLPLEIERSVSQQLMAPACLPPRHKVPHFGHIFGGGYAVGYYSYLWSEVLEADVFNLFQSQGLYDPPSCAAVTALYEAGGSVDPMELFHGVMGRAPDPQAVLTKWGVTPPKKTTRPS